MPTISSVFLRSVISAPVVSDTRTRWYTDFEVDFHLEHSDTSSLARVWWYLCSLFSVKYQDYTIEKSLGV
jgi:hypothetical protein